MKTIPRTHHSRTSEHVGSGHPDKACDQVADAILDAALCLTEQAERGGVRTAIECLAKDRLLVISGEVRWNSYVAANINVDSIARAKWREIGYPDADALTVINHLQTQSPDIALGVDVGGAGDQGVMVGYATNETPEMMPKEWVLARDICMKLHDLRGSSALPWLGADTKSQVTLDAEGNPVAFIVAAQHLDSKVCGLSQNQIREIVFEQAVQPILGSNIKKVLTKINGTGEFVIGGAIGDAGVVGRKIVVDAYGPRVPVGGGAYSGKDPSKVDRSGAYMCRHMAKQVVNLQVNGAKECTVSLAYGIGQLQPEMLTAIIDTGEDVSEWLWRHFPDLSQGEITRALGLRECNGWRYQDTAAYGHYGRSQFPWEALILA